MKIVLIIFNLLVSLAVVFYLHPAFHTVDNITRARMVVELSKSGQIDSNDIDRYWYGFNIGESSVPDPNTVLYQSQVEGFQESVTIPVAIVCAVNLLLIGTFWPSRNRLTTTECRETA